MKAGFPLMVCGRHGRVAAKDLDRGGSCGCCCSVLRGRTRWDNPAAFAPSNFATHANDHCVLCGSCAERCFFEAITLDEEEGRAVVDPDKCAGCRVYTMDFAQDAIRLIRLERTEPFPGSKELYRAVVMENRGGSGT